MSTPFRRRPVSLLPIAALAFALVGCASSAAEGGSSGVPERDVVDSHGAAEIAEPARALVVVDEHGGATLLDLDTQERATLAEPGAERIADVEGTGRFVFLVRDDAVEVIESGRWTQPHGDHSHYFRGDPRTLGVVDGEGRARIGVGADATVIRFPDDAAVLEHETMSEGDVDPARSELDGHGPAIVVAGRLFGATDASIETAGQPAVPCRGATDVDLTRVGAVFACDEGAVLITREIDGTASSESIPYPAGVAAPAEALSGRPDRPDLAGVTEGGVWLLDVRERTWAHLPSDVPLIAAGAIGDDDARTAVIASDGTVRVLAPDGTVLACSEPLLVAALADPSLGERVQLLVDGEHAYVSDPRGGAVHEIDLDDGTVSRTFDDLHPWAIELVG